FALVDRVPFVERFVPLPQRFVEPVPLMVAPAMMTAEVGFVPLPPLRTALSIPFDENRFERLVRVEGFAPVDVMVQRVSVAPVDTVLLQDRFLALDVDRDRFVTFDEWTGPRTVFTRLDLNRDRMLVPGEVVVSNPLVRTVTMVDRDRYVAFNMLDQDDDGLIAAWEWTGDMGLFFRLDVDNNGVIDQAEYLGYAPVRPVPVR